MNTRFIETFVLLARLGSVRRVAEQMHASPGAISMRVRALEKELGVTLFAWDHKTLEITADGSRLLRHAETLIEATRALTTAATSHHAPGGRIRIGVIETVVHTFLPDLMKAVGSRLPQIELDMTIDMTSQLADQLMRRDLDLICRVTGDTDNPYVVTENLLEIPMHWIARRGLVTAREPLQKALGMQLFTLMRGSLPHAGAMALAQQLAAQQGMATSDLRITGSPSLAALVSMVREGVGVAIMPGVLVREFLDRNELVELALPPPEPYRISVCYPKKVIPSVAKVVDVVRRISGSYCRRTGDRWSRSIA